MNDEEIRERIARDLKMRRVDDRLWQVLMTFHPDEVLTARSGDEEYLGMLSDLSERYLGAAEILGDTPAISARAKLRHVAHDISIEDELRAEAIWDAQVEAAVSDSNVMSFRHRVLDGKYLTDDEAITVLNSPAIACLSWHSLQAFGVTAYNHQSAVLRGRVDGKPGTDVVVAVQPGDFLWTLPVDTHSLRWDVTNLPRWMVNGYERYEDHEDSTEGEQETNYLWNLYHLPIYELVAWRGSVLQQLMNLAVDVSEKYAFGDPADLLWFILVGNVLPSMRPAPIQVEVLPVRRGGEASFIRLDVRPWVSADVVLNHYRSVQKRLLGGVNRPTQARNLVLFRFVTSALSDGSPSWPEMATEWNENLPHMAESHPDWRVDDTWRWASWRDMNKEYKRVRKKVLRET